MVRKFIVGLIAALMIVLSACGGSKEKADNGTKSTEEAVTEATKEVKTESSVPSKKSEGADLLFPKAEKLLEIPMGTCIDGKQTPFLTIKLPADALTGGTYTDENGKKQMMNQSSDALSVLVDQGLYGTDKVATHMNLIDHDESFDITVKTYDETKHSDEVYATKGTKLSQNGDFSNWYVKTDTNEFFIFVYKNEWVVQLIYSGDLREKYTDKEIAEAFNAIMTDL